MPATTAAVWLAALLCGGGAGPAAPSEPALAPITPPPRAEVQAGIDKGIAFLLRSQNANGSWGGAFDSLTTWSGSVWSNPESHRSWRVATTGLVLAALLETGPVASAEEATDRCLRYMLDNADVKRPDERDLMNNWAYIYGLQGLAAAYAHPRYADDAELQAEMAAAMREHLEHLARFQSVLGGWGYLALNSPRTRRPQWATSFTTAAAIVAMVDAQRAGVEPDPEVLGRAARIVEHCRLPNGAYTYHVRAIPNLHSEYIDQVKGSLCRITCCQAALIDAGREIPLADRIQGLVDFTRHHKFIEIAMHKPVPHESYYANSGYFFMFGHYYAALIIEDLPAEERARWWPRLQRYVLDVQQEDGSIWDYDMHGYDRPYGVAFGLMALQRSLADNPQP